MASLLQTVYNWITVHQLKNKSLMLTILHVRKNYETTVKTFTSYHLQMTLFSSEAIEHMQKKNWSENKTGPGPVVLSYLCAHMNKLMFTLS